MYLILPYAILIDIRSWLEHIYIVWIATPWTYWGDSVRVQRNPRSVRRSVVGAAARSK